MRNAIRPADAAGATPAGTAAAVDERLLDRLVDGELDDGQRRALLRGLDDTADGWKRCALAFLEAQSWRRAIATPAGDAVSVPPQPPPPRRAKPAAARLLAVAAAVAIAFAVGALSGASWRPPADRDVADRDDPRPSRPAPSTLEAKHGRAAPGEVGRVKLPPAAAPVQVPVIAAADGDAQNFLSRPLVLPEYLRRQLERRGYEIEGDRELLSVPLADGRTVTIPVETVRYRYVGYQVH